MKYYHLTDNFLGTGCVLYPRVPRNAFEDDDQIVIEDDTTPRTSFAKSIESALLAVADNPYSYFVYSTDQIRGLKKPAIKFNCPSSPGNPYGPDFQWTPFAKYEGIDPSDNALRREILVGCIPDAKVTKEVWATKPTTVELESLFLRSGRHLQRFGGGPRLVYPGDLEFEAITEQLASICKTYD